MDTLDELLSSAGAEPTPGPDEIQRYPLYVPDEEWPALFVDRDTVRCWCELDEDFDIQLLSLITGFQHSVPIFIEEVGIGELVGCTSYRDGNIAWALENAVTYRQPFYIELTAHYYISYTEYGPEGDCDTYFELLERKPISDQEIAARFQEWIDRKPAS